MTTVIVGLCVLIGTVYEYNDEITRGTVVDNEGLLDLGFYVWNRRE